MLEFQEAVGGYQRTTGDVLIGRPLSVVRSAVRRPVVSGIREGRLITGLRSGPTTDSSPPAFAPVRPGKGEHRAAPRRI